MQLPKVRKTLPKPLSARAVAPPMLHNRVGKVLLTLASFFCCPEPNEKYSPCGTLSTLLEGTITPPLLMQPPKVWKTAKKPTICPCGSTGSHAYNSSGWMLPFYATTPTWRDPIAIWHNKRSTLGFADGHAEMHGWVDQETIGYSAVQPDNPDLEYMRRGYPHLILSNYAWVNRTY